MKAAACTLGCKVSQYETQAIVGLLEQDGYEIVPFTEKADVYLINSCTVTATADQKSRQMTRRAKRLNPAAVVVLCGCYPQALPADAAAVAEADVVLGTCDRSNVPAMIRRFRETGERIVDVKRDNRHEAYEELSVDRLDEHTRAFVKIEDGCDRFCTYCMVPFARGNIRSRSLVAIKSEVERLTANGYREIILTGINLSAYGRADGRSLADAVDAAVAGGAERVRLGSLEPDLMTDDLLTRLSAEPRFCRQFHLSLQSGSDGVLRRMGRPYTAADYADLVSRLRASMPDCAITTDIMVGFAGETEEEFAETLRFVGQIGFASAHIFIYSPRPGTVAAEMPDRVLPETAKRRSKALTAAVAESRRAYLRSLDGKTLSVLALEEKADRVLGIAKDGAEVLLPKGSKGILSVTVRYENGVLLG